jgi:hypothetical protein
VFCTWFWWWCGGDDYLYWYVWFFPIEESVSKPAQLIQRNVLICGKNCCDYNEVKDVFTRSEFFTAALLKIQDFWVVTVWHWVSGWRRFERTWYLKKAGNCSYKDKASHRWRLEVSLDACNLLMILQA